MLRPSKQCLSSTGTQYDIHRVQAQPVDQLEVHGNLTSTGSTRTRVRRRVGTGITRVSNTSRQVHLVLAYNHKNLVGGKFNPLREHQGGDKAQHPGRSDEAPQAHRQRHMNFEYGTHELRGLQVQPAL